MRGGEKKKRHKIEPKTQFTTDFGTKKKSFKLVFNLLFIPECCAFMYLYCLMILSCNGLFFLNLNLQI
jgi:hypothetical protein